MEDAISISYFRKYLHFKIFEGSEFCDLSTPEDIWYSYVLNLNYCGKKDEDVFVRVAGSVWIILLYLRTGSYQYMNDWLVIGQT